MAIRTGCVHYFSFTLMLLTFTALSASSDMPSQEEFDLTKFFEVWKEYLAYPSSENAGRVAALLPDTGHIEEYTSTDQVSEIRWEILETLAMLERQVYASDEEAVRLAFRLLVTYADGASAEELDIILGALIRINPTLFLEQLHDHRHHVERLDALIGNFGREYDGRDKAERLEASLRIQALQRVSDPKLVRIRDECIELLESFYGRAKED